MNWKSVGRELGENGYEVLRGENLKSFLDAARNSAKDINVPTKTTVLGVFVELGWDVRWNKTDICY